MNKYDNDTAILDDGELKEVGELANKAPDHADHEDIDQFETAGISHSKLKKIYAELDAEEQEELKANGGPGSGNHGHAGRPGERGGSASGGDADYSNALEKGDTKKAKALLEEAAYSAGYTHTMFHGTHNTFDSFDRHAMAKDRIGLKLDTIGSWFTDSKDNAEMYGPKVIPVFIKAQNPVVYDGLGGWNDFYQDVKDNHGSAEAFRKWAIEKGHDSVLISGDYVDGSLQTMRIVFEPEQIKSAQLEVKGTDDEVIPLLKRFDSSSKLLVNWADVHPDNWPEVI